MTPTRISRRCRSLDLRDACSSALHRRGEVGATSPARHGRVAKSVLIARDALMLKTAANRRMPIDTFDVSAPVHAADVHFVKDLTTPF